MKIGEFCNPNVKRLCVLLGPKSGSLQCMSWNHLHAFVGELPIIKQVADKALGPSMSAFLEEPKDQAPLLVLYEIWKR